MPSNIQMAGIFDKMARQRRKITLAKLIKLRPIFNKMIWK